MSYSIALRAATAAATLAAAAAKFDADVIAHQPCHKVDREAALKNAEAALGTLTNAPAADEEIVLQMHGSVSGLLNPTAGEPVITAINISATAWIEKAKPPQA